MTCRIKSAKRIVSNFSAHIELELQALEIFLVFFFFFFSNFLLLQHESRHWLVRLGPFLCFNSNPGQRTVASQLAVAT